MLFAEVVYECKAAIHKSLFIIFQAPIYCLVPITLNPYMLFAYTAEHGLLSVLRVYRLDEERVCDGDAVCALIGISLRPYRADSVSVVLNISAFTIVLVFIPSRRV